jgi:thiol:disulfide interchange protein
MDSKSGFLFFLVVGCVAAYVGYRHTGRAPQLAGAEMVARQGEYQAALDESRRAGKPVVLDFYADWCGPCQWMKANTWGEPRVKQAMRNYVFVSVNVDQNQELARLYSVSSIPRVVVISPEGKILASQVGAMPPDRLLSWLPDARPNTGGTE